MCVRPRANAYKNLAAFFVFFARFAQKYRNGKIALASLGHSLYDITR